jgi:hypothetical protein
MLTHDHQGKITIALRRRVSLACTVPLLLLLWIAPVGGAQELRSIAEKAVQSQKSTTHGQQGANARNNPNPEPNQSNKRLLKKSPEISPEQPNDGGETRGWLQLDLPEKVKVGKQYDLDVWLDPKDTNFSGSAKVYFEQTDRVTYDPRVFDLKTGERKTIKFQVNSSESGLTEIMAMADGWEDLAISLDAGFTAKLKPNNLPESIDGGTVQGFNLIFVDTHGDPVRLDAPVQLTVQSTKLLIRRKGEGGWGNRVDINLPRGTGSTPVIAVKPEAWAKTEMGTLQASLTEETGTVLSDVTFPQIKVRPRWWLPLMLAILGGITFSLYQVSQELPSLKSQGRGAISTVVVSRVMPGALAGAIAYLLANYEVLGFKADTTQLRGFLILGFLFAYVGIDTILKIVTAKK